MRPEMTAKQKRFLDYLEYKIAEKGSAPSLREAADDLDVSHAAIAQLVRVLEQKGYLKREGRYSRMIYLLNRVHQASGMHRSLEVPIIGNITAGLPMYAQQEWDGTIVVDGDMYRGQNLFALRVAGDSMSGVGILSDDLVICESREYAENGDIVVALINNEEATVKRFFLRKDGVELCPENKKYRVRRYGLAEVAIQGRVIGVQRGPAQMLKL